jgi:hypothetical protein
MQAPPPVPPPGGGAKVADRLARTEKEANLTKSADRTAQRALEYCLAFIKNGKRQIQAGQLFAADRTAEAAAAMLRVAEHQQHLRQPDGPRIPPPTDIHDHLQRVYFRIQQANFFLEQVRDPRVSEFPKWSHDFYQLAVRAYERQDFLAADENAKSADDIVKALESLAQAASNVPPRPLPPGLPPGGRP